MATSGELLERAAAYLRRRCVPEAQANAEWLLAHVLGRGRLDALLRPAEPVSVPRRRRLLALLRRRGRREPLAYVLGTQAFLDFSVRVGPAVLVPRPETEELVEAAALASPGAAAALDVGTGSGCIAIGLARRLPRLRVVATDASARALALARANARRCGVASRVRFAKADLFPRARTPWADLVVSNPPYIASARVARLAPELRREPRLALDGGPDGLAAIRRILAEAPRQLKPGGRLALELAAGQGRRVVALARCLGWREVTIRPDAQAVPRILLATL